MSLDEFLHALIQASKPHHAQPALVFPTVRARSALSPTRRVLFRGYLPIMSGAAMALYLKSQGVGRETVKAFVFEQAARLKTHALDWCTRTGRPYHMYDRGPVLRVGTVINNPEEFRIRKRVRREGRDVMAWVPLRKERDVAVPISRDLGAKQRQVPGSLEPGTRPYL